MLPMALRLPTALRCFLGYSFAHQENPGSGFGSLLLGEARPLQSSIITSSNLPLDSKAFGQYLSHNLLNIDIS